MFDRRYNASTSSGQALTGNVSGICPECGTAIQPAAGGGQQAAKGASA